MAIGDGANDLTCWRAPGFGIAFNAKPVVRDQADTAVNVPHLDSVLFLLGIPARKLKRQSPARLPQTTNAESKSASTQRSYHPSDSTVRHLRGTPHRKWGNLALRWRTASELLPVPAS